MSAIIIGISGSTSSGKTTLSLILSAIFSDNALNSIHEDDFFRPKTARTTDTDCFEAVDLERFITKVKHVRTTEHITLPKTPPARNEPSFRVENVDDQKLYNDLIQQKKRELRIWISGQISKSRYSEWEDTTILMPSESSPFGPRAVIKPKFCFVDGFLLYSKVGEPFGGVDNMTASYLNTIAREELMRLFDIRLFLPVTKQVASERRFSREPYIDPPNGSRLAKQWWKTEEYFNKIAWPNYTRNNGFLFDDNCVEKVPFGVTMRRGLSPEKENVFIMDSMNATLEDTVNWAMKVILKELEEIGRKARYSQVLESIMAEEDDLDPYYWVEYPCISPDKPCLRKKLKKFLKKHVLEKLEVFRPPSKMDRKLRRQTPEVLWKLDQGIPVKLNENSGFEEWRQRHRGDGTFSRLL